MSRAGPGGSRRCARALADVCRDVDRFLDPTVLALVAREENSDAAAVAVRKEARSRNEQGEGSDLPDGREKRRRSNERESEEGEELLGQLRREHEVERRRLQAEVDQRDEQLKTAMALEAHARREAEVLQKHVSDFKRRSAEFRSCSEELAGLKGAQKEVLSKEELVAQQKELEQLRSKHVCHEQELAALQAQVIAREKALSSAGSAASGAELAKRDLASLAAVAASIIAELRSGDDDNCSARAGAAEGLAEAKGATPFELSLAWSKWQRRMADVNQHCEELQRSFDQSSRREQKAQEEFRRLRADLAASQARCADQESDLRRSKSESASLASRNATLRDALQRGAVGAAPPEPAHEQLDAAQARAACLSDRLRERETELRLCTEELAALKSERQAPEEARPGPEADEKILHLLQRPFDPAPAAAGPADAEALAACDLERQQAVKQFKCLQRGVKKHVLDYKEGIAALLGWHVEMREEGSSSRWHLTSKLQSQEGQSLIFQRKPGRGRKAEFELMSTPWAEQLQEDRQAISYIELYRSNPGFLAHITADLLAKRTLSG